MKPPTHVRPGWKADRARLEAEMAGRVGAMMHRLRDYRTAAEAARVIGIARPIYSRLERGAHMPTLSFLILAISGLGGNPNQEILDLVSHACPAALGKKRR
jgi:transcriptional regulator with XRE-family HTH domain